MKTPTTTLIISEQRKSIRPLGVVARLLPGAITVATGVVLFGPSSLVERLGLVGLLRTRRDLLGAVCVMACSVLVVTQLLPLAFRALVRTLRSKAEFRKGKKRLRALNRSEKNLLNLFLGRNRMALMLDVKSSATQALLRDGIIDRAAEMDESETSLAFTLRPWVREYLRVNVELVESERTTGSARVTDIRTRQPMT